MGGGRALGGRFDQLYAMAAAPNANGDFDVTSFKDGVYNVFWFRTLSSV